MIVASTTYGEGQVAVDPVPCAAMIKGVRGLTKKRRRNL